MTFLTCFTYHNFIPCQQVNIILINEVTLYETPLHFLLYQTSIEKSLYRSVTSPFFTPARYPQHCDPSCHY